jgi:restriction endonuclease
LKGKLFEIIVGYVFQHRGYTTRLGWEIGTQSGIYDVDITGVGASDAVIVECKGYREGVPVEHSEVKRHFTERTPSVRYQLLQDKFNKPKAFRSIVVTTGTFEDAVQSSMKSGEFGHKPDTQLEVWDRQRLMKELEIDQHHDLIQVISKYYGP